MNKATAIKCLFLDIGGVLLSNGWDHLVRKRAAKHFGIDYAEMDAQHRLNFEIYEQGKLTIDEYLGRVVFNQKRTFTIVQFRNFMFAQSKSYPNMLELVAQLRFQHALKIVVVSNEGREMNAYRTKTFKLNDFVDCFISSSFVHLRKPDIDIFRVALDVSSTPADHVLYIENTRLFVEVAASLGIRGILHTDYLSTCDQLISLGLLDGASVLHAAS
jgi:putative hydrolase of the HAD superfamily